MALLSKELGVDLRGEGGVLSDGANQMQLQSMMKKSEGELALQLSNMGASHTDQPIS